MERVRKQQLLEQSIYGVIWSVIFFLPLIGEYFAVEVLMKEEDSVFNERQSVDLTPYLRGFDGDEISLELDLHIGRELEIGGPVIIPDWEDTPETEFP